jgi:hypothetical protein
MAAEAEASGAESGAFQVFFRKSEKKAKKRLTKFSGLCKVKGRPEKTGAGRGFPAAVFGIYREGEGALSAEAGGANGKKTRP